MARYMDVSQEKVTALLQEETRQQEEVVVVELTVSCTGLNLPFLTYLLYISLRSLRLSHLTCLLREARVYFWPLVRVSRALAMEASRGEQSEGSQGEIRLVRGEGGSRRRRGKAARQCKWQWQDQPGGPGHQEIHCP